MSLYGKYRPQNFSNLVGQDQIRDTLLHEIQNSTFAHAYLFAGPRGTGKTSAARLIAKAINCTQKNDGGEPCDSCEFCTSIKDGRLIDVIEIDAASNRGIDEIRDLKEKILFAPTRASSKTYIVDEVHMLTKDAFNALLKTLEEPPQNVYFILCTTEIHKIPETIISRCQRFDFKRIDVKTIITRLSHIAQIEGIEAEDAALELIARHAEGGMRDALGLFEQMAVDKKLSADHVRAHLGITGRETVEKLIALIRKKNAGEALNLIWQIYDDGYDLQTFMRELLECLREKLIAGVRNGGREAPAWINIIDELEKARDMMRIAIIPQLPLEIAAIRLCGEVGPVQQDLDDEEKETAANLKQTYEVDEAGVVKQWSRVLERLHPPSLRRSLQESSVAESEDGQIFLTFGSQFHFEKSKGLEQKAKIEKIIFELFGKNVRVNCSLVAGKEEAAPKEPKHNLVKETPKESLIKKAMELFEEEG